MALFDEFPRIEGERVLLRELADSDADALAELANNNAIYNLEPTFLVERQYDDMHEAIDYMRHGCFEAQESLFLAVCLLAEPDNMLGLVEMYAYEPAKPKVSIGIRLIQRYWGLGITNEITCLLKNWLIDEVGIRTITAHVMVENYSWKPLAKNGFVCLYPHCWEDWGRGDPVLIDKWVYKRRWSVTGPDVPQVQEQEDAMSSANQAAGQEKEPMLESSSGLVIEEPTLLS